MKKTRSDSAWGKLAPEQRAQLDQWYFKENLSYREMLERAQKDFGVTASLQSLAAYLRRREEPPELADHTPLPVEAMRENPFAGRVGAGKTREDLEGLALHFTAMAAYEMALTKPGKMRVKELRSLLKALVEDRRLTLDRETRGQKLKIQEMLAVVKAGKDLPAKRGVEDWKKLIDEAGEIVKRMQGNSPEMEECANERPKE